MYIDPGSGSMLFQVLIASLVGSLIAFRRALHGLVVRVAPWYRRRRSGDL
ncbi:MAG: hypothetical protein IPP58_15985 [Holophagaceae bacterium]|uniref:Uncharacterized protein n=1 Tax=Candidatus Geothrix skivensis TaxID=2954439 RepID=A0A9D7SHT3_9BACT|nr:hypothetical protein [Candidatus Geothrix skivensis]